MTKYRASRPDAEQKVHFKLYKSGTIWVVMGITTVSMALLGGQVNASAETATTAASETTTISSSPEVNSISGDSVVLGHNQSSAADTATTQSTDTEKTDDQLQPILQSLRQLFQQKLKLILHKFNRLRLWQALKTQLQNRQVQ
ncbi:KxYKxGKxW signal peptide domain-containing protein [Secundilactobacillus silagei]|uniref:KxYKxGKxW signal peptide domain-containing protein n=1 Tax=Secundilactobacillus silagei TaxID=1293415 RepID=UPI0006D22A59|nr:KxYKxGKxW signal peptide domain-containing protein [Secundilactobacillus silagei]